MDKEKEEFTVTLPDGVKISCLLRKAKDPLAAGVVVLAHGRFHTKSRGPMALIEPLLPFSTLSFDARGMGESDGSTGYSNIAEEADDLAVVLQHWASNLATPYDKKSILAVCGHSKGAVVALTLGSQHRLPCSLIVNVSGRYESSNVVPTARFTAAQNEELNKNGSFVWLNYRAGKEPERPLRRPYVVTQQELDGHVKRTLECVTNLPEGTMVLNLHGKSDGTVPYDQALQTDAAIRRGQASSDVMLLDGVKHNWEEPGQAALLAALIQGWILSRKDMKVTRLGEGDLVDHLGQFRKKNESGTSTPPP